MRVKRYIVDTLPEALNQIRQELGKDAVILNTKQLHVGGILGMFRKKKIEVIAAIDSSAAASDRAHQRAVAAVAASNERTTASRGGSVTAVTGRNSNSAADSGISVPMPDRSSGPAVGSIVAAQAYRNTVRSTSEAKDPSSPILPELEREPRSASSVETPVREAEGQPAPAVDQAVERFKRAAAQTIQDAAARSHTKQTEETAATTNAESLDPRELLQEIKEMKSLVAQLTGQGKASDAPLATAHDPFAKLKARLDRQGVLPTIADELQHRALENSGKTLSEVDEDQARQLLREELLRVFREQPATGIAEDSRIIQFVGPTGVGKTTTIAKLAAEQVLKFNRQVGFITSDTYRIAAIDQLKTYATILNVPVEVVFSPDEMEGALSKLSDRNLIFMDTAGRNYRDASGVSELSGLINEHGQSETYLVLSLVSKYEDIKAIIENFRHFKVDKVLWTKMDETASYGSVLNVLIEYNLPLSYITNGQNVPDDITILRAEEIVEHLMGEDEHG